MRVAPDQTVTAAFNDLLVASDKDENDIQRFLESNTALIETPHLLNHRLHLNCVLAKLPIGPWKTDFAYLTKSSVAWRLVLIELERPSKALFQTRSNHHAFHSDLNNAIAQIDEWRDRWETHKHEVISKIEPLLVPNGMRKNSITPHYVLVIGRDQEFGQNDSRKRRLAALMEDKKLQVLTYDSLLRTYKEGRGYMKCILSPTATGYKIKHLDGEPEHLFAYVEPQHLEVTPEMEAELVSRQFDISAWRRGEPLIINGRHPASAEHLLPPF